MAQETAFYRGDVEQLRRRFSRLAGHPCGVIAAAVELWSAAAEWAQSEVGRQTGSELRIGSGADTGSVKFPHTARAAGRHDLAGSEPGPVARLTFLVIFASSAQP